MSRRSASLLAVCAHPDDEVFHAGTLASVSGRGVRVTLASATAGDAGKVDPSICGALAAAKSIPESQLRAQRTPLPFGVVSGRVVERWRKDPVAQQIIGAKVQPEFFGELHRRDEIHTREPARVRGVAVLRRNRSLIVDGHAAARQRRQVEADAIAAGGQTIVDERAGGLSGEKVDAGFAGADRHARRDRRIERADCFVGR